MSGAIPVLPLYAFMAWTGITKFRVNSLETNQINPGVHCLLKEVINRELVIPNSEQAKAENA
jgi:hypothetical protein